jgi:propanediol dehydratase small subunit
MTPIAKSGRPVDEITLDALRSGALTAEDVRIHPATLERQAQVAETHGNPQLAANFRRAAELTDLPDERVMARLDPAVRDKVLVCDVSAAEGGGFTTL